MQEVVHEAMDAFDLVTREEFDTARELLSNTRIRLEAMEKRVEALETALAEAQGGEKTPAEKSDAG